MVGREQHLINLQTCTYFCVTLHELIRPSPTGLLLLSHDWPQLEPIRDNCTICSYDRASMTASLEPLFH